ncbi:MAG: hypothetical protein V1735_06935 [Nanoarchaeota archaeon]
MPAYRRAFGLSAGIDLREYFDAESLMRHAQISARRRSVLEDIISETFFKEGSETDISLSYVSAFLYEELFPALCKEGGLEQTGSGSADPDASRLKMAEFQAAFQRHLAGLRIQSYDEFSAALRKNLISREQPVLGLAPPQDGEPVNLARMLSSIFRTDYLIWDGEVFVMQGGSRTLDLTIDGKTTHPGVDFRMPMKEEIEADFQKILSNYVIRTVDEELIRETYAKAKYSATMFAGKQDYAQFGFEVIKRGGKPTVFLYQTLDPFYMMDPRPEVDAYYPYLEPKRVGIELTYRGGRLIIVDCLVSGPTKHYAVLKPEMKYYGMCNWVANSRKRELFSSDAMWVISNMGSAVEMFVNGLSPDNLLKHGCDMTSTSFSGSHNMPDVVRKADLQPGIPILNTHHIWPGERHG